MPDIPTPNVMAAAREIAYEFLAEPCREVDDDFNVCACKVDPDDISKIAAIITRCNADAEREGELCKNIYRRDVCIVGEILNELEPLLGLEPQIGDSISERILALSSAITELLQKYRKYEEYVEVVQLFWS